MAEQTFDDAAFAAWRKDNPGRPYSEFSAQKVARALEDGRAHPTLGKNLTRDDNWEEAGRKTFQELLGFCAVPQGGKVLEYGCGSLRVGKHFMARQPKGHFCGLDVTEDFIAHGRDLIGRQRLEASAPLLGPIGSTLEQAVQFGADFLYATHVVIHVHPDEFDVCFDNFQQLIAKPGGQIVFDALVTPSPVRFRNSGWGWPIRRYLEALPGFQLTGLRYRMERADVGQEFLFCFERLAA